MCSDDRSERMAREWMAASLPTSSSSPSVHYVHRIYRARAVKQSYVTSIFTSAISFFHCLYVLLLHVGNPKMLLINGPGTSLILLLALRVLNFICLTTTPTIYAESVCRVKRWSLTGKLVGLVGARKCKMWKGLKGGESIEGVLFRRHTKSS